MERRKFIKVMTAGGCIAVTPIALSACSSSIQTDKERETGSQDIKLKLISYAMLAPNPHNIQPWLIKITGENSFDLYVDQTRLLPDTDPPARQVHIGQGTFLEGLRIASQEFGYRSDITLFPKGEYSNESIENKPVASIVLVKDATVKKDPLFKYLLPRQSNKRVYEEKNLSTEAVARIAQKVDQSGFTFQSTKKGTPTFEKLTDIAGGAMAIEIAKENRNRETAHMFRFTEEEAKQKRDGFTVANNGMTGFMRWVVESFFLGTREEAFSPDGSFALEAVKLTQKQARSAAGFAWITTDTNSRRDQVKTGQIYMRINLTNTMQGVSQHPMSQVLQEYPDMADLQKGFKQLLKISPGKTVQMFFRLGYAESVPHTKRRKVQDILFSA